MPTQNSSYKNQKKKNIQKGNTLISGVIFSLISSVIAMFAFSLIFSAILTKVQNPAALFKPMSVLIWFMSGAICGIASRKNKQNALSTSLIAGILLLIVFSIVSIFLQPTPFEITITYCVINILALLSATIFFSAKKNNYNKKKRRS